MRVWGKLLTGVLLFCAAGATAQVPEVYSAAVQLSSFNLLFAKE